MLILEEENKIKEKEKIENKNKKLSKHLKILFKSKFLKRNINKKIKNTNFSDHNFLLVMIKIWIISNFYENLKKNLFFFTTKNNNQMK